MKDTLLAILCWVSVMTIGLHAQGTSAAENLAALQESFTKYRNGFFQELDTVPEQPNKLQDGTVASQLEILCGKDLKDLLERVNNQRDILRKKLTAIDATAGLSEADKAELKGSIASQKKPLDDLEKQISVFRESMMQLKTGGIESLRTLHEQFLSIKGEQAAQEKLRNRILQIKAPYLPKPPPSPKPSATPTATPKSGADPLQWNFAAPAQADMRNAGMSPKILPFEEARRRADSGDPYAQAVVSIYYATGYMVMKNLPLAAKYALLSAQQKNPLGLYRLGVLRESGEGGIPPNPQEGIALKAAAFQGLNNQMVGDPYAITALGVMCFRGEGGVNKNPSEAASLYKKAADMGYAPAQYCYSACLYNGQGVQRNPELAERYWRLACQQQYPPALKGKPVD